MIRRTVPALAALTIGWAAFAQSHSGNVRLGPDEYQFPESSTSSSGSSGTVGIRSTVLKGNLEGPGLYTILLSIPPSTTIAAHSHRDDRVGVVISGDWEIGYGPAFREDGLKDLDPGGYYTEPPGEAHYARTGPAGALVMVTGYGPTDTQYSPGTKGFSGSVREGPASRLVSQHIFSANRRFESGLIHPNPSAAPPK